MAFLAGRREKKNQLTILTERVAQLERENLGLHETVDRLERANADLREQLRRRDTETKEEEEPVAVAPPAVQSDDDYYEPLDRTITEDIIDHVRGVIRASNDVNEDSKYAASDGDVLVVYFQMTKTIKEIYGYSIINHAFLNDSQTLSLIDSKNYIQLHFYQNAKRLSELENSETICIVVHGSLDIEPFGPTTKIDRGDIVLWIRTDKPIDRIKRSLQQLFNKMLKTLYLKCSNAVRCEDAAANVETIANIIGGEYKDIVLRAPEPERPAPRKAPARAPVSSAGDVKQYLDSIMVPQLRLERAQDKPIFAEYWENGADAVVDLNVKNNIPGEAPSMRVSRILAESAEVRKKAAVSKYQRIYFGTSLKEVAAYIIKMVDYLNQTLELSWGSPMLIDESRNFFYGHDLGRHEHISGPTPLLEDLMDHMWDVRQGLVYIDELCWIVARGIEQQLRESPSPGPLLMEFGKRIMAGAFRHQEKKAFAEYEANTMYNIRAHLRNHLKKLVPKDTVGSRLGSDEITRIYSNVTRCSIRNYWEVAKALGLQKDFVYIEPDSYLEHKLETSLEKLVGQSQLGSGGLFLPFIVDGDRVQRPKFHFLVHWRQLVVRAFKDSFDEMMYEMGVDNRLGSLVDLGHVVYEENKNRKKDILNRLLNVDGDLRPVLANLITQAFDRTIVVLEARYNMERPLSVGPRETSIVEHEEYAYSDVYKVIQYAEPKWADKKFRNENLNLWIMARPLELFMVYPPSRIGNLTVQGLSYIEWVALFGVETAIRNREASY